MSTVQQATLKVRQAKAKLRRARVLYPDECAKGSAGGLSAITRARRLVNTVQYDRAVTFRPELSMWGERP